MHGERLSARRITLRRPAHDGELDVPLLHERDDLLAIVGDLQPNLDAQVLLPELREQSRQEVLGGTDHAHIERAGLQAAKARDQILGIAHDREHAAGMRQHVFPDHRQRDPAAGSIEHRQAHFSLEFLDLHGHGRRGEIRAPRPRE